jgi:hypothetical protein
MLKHRIAVAAIARQHRRAMGLDRQPSGRLRDWEIENYVLDAAGLLFGVQNWSRLKRSVSAVVSVVTFPVQGGMIVVQVYSDCPTTRAR